MTALISKQLRPGLILSISLHGLKAAATSPQIRRPSVLKRLAATIQKTVKNEKLGHLGATSHDVRDQGF